MTKRILISPDKFKGSLTARAAAEAMARGVHAVYPDAVCTLAPIADGGEGTAEVFAQMPSAEWVELTAKDPIGREVSGRYVWVADSAVAIIDMSEMSGLWRLFEVEYAPLLTTTCGTGELFRHAVRRGAKKIMVGLGGSATSDGGLGFARALGWRFLTSEGREIERPRDLLTLEKIEKPEGRFTGEVVALCDVQNPLLGKHGAAAVYGPQKGATPDMVGQLDQGLTRLVEVYRKTFGQSPDEVPGAGAAGGLAFGLMAFAGARLEPGFDTIAELLGLPEKMREADLVITGEGRIDAQSAHGKGPYRLAEMARAAGRPIVAFAGVVDHAPDLFREVTPIADPSVSREESIQKAAIFLEEAVRASATRWKI